MRRAILAAIDQVEVMTAVMGEEKSLYRAPVGYFLPGNLTGVLKGTVPVFWNVSKS